MDNATKHLEKLQIQLSKKFGKERTKQILTGLNELTGDETPEQVVCWAGKLTERLEQEIDPENLIEIREQCACIKANKYSAYNKKYFPELRAKYPDDTEYTKAVAEFLNGRGRAGRIVTFQDGKFLSHFSFGNRCVCYVIQGGWEKPPSTTWCRCCQGTLKSIFQFVFPEKKCCMDIVETFATGVQTAFFRSGTKKSNNHNGASKAFRF